MTAQLEVVVDSAVGCEETLGVAGRFEPLHLPFSSSRRLVRYFGTVVEVAALPMLDAGRISRFAAA